MSNGRRSDPNQHNHVETIPAIVEAGMSRTVTKLTSSPFRKLRIECDELGFTLERLKKGYLLSGKDLPIAGVQCWSLDEVEEELANY